MARAKRKRLKGSEAKKRAPSALPADDLNATSRAQLGPDEDKREYRPRQDDASVEDPLQDWPEDS